MTETQSTLWTDEVFPPETLEPLCERDTAGLKIRLYELGMFEPMVILAVETENHKATVEVPPGEAMQAFRHPCTYLSDPSPFA